MSDTATYPRTCRNGHRIEGPSDEKTSGHRQCLQCRRESQDHARDVFIQRWWLEECGFTKEHAKAIQQAGYEAFSAYLEQVEQEYTAEEYAYAISRPGDEGYAFDLGHEDKYVKHCQQAQYRQNAAEQAEAEKYPEGQLASP